MCGYLPLFSELAWTGKGLEPRFLEYRAGASGEGGNPNGEQGRGVAGVVGGVSLGCPQWKGSLSVENFKIIIKSSESGLLFSYHHVPTILRE